MGILTNTNTMVNCLHAGKFKRTTVSPGTHLHFIIIRNRGYTVVATRGLFIPIFVCVPQRFVSSHALNTGRLWKFDIHLLVFFVFRPFSKFA